MRLINKVVAGIILITILTLGTTFYFIDRCFFSNFKAIEIKEIMDNIRIYRSSLYNIEARLNDTNKDWSTWDDTYQFTQDFNDNYKNKNITKETFMNLKINYFIIVNNSGKVVYSKGFDFNNGNSINIPLDLIKYIESDKSINKFTEINSYKSGFTALDGNNIVISAMPIVKRNYEGPINGALIMAKNITPAEMNRPSRAVSGIVNLVSFNKATKTKVSSFQFYKDGENSIFIKPEGKDRILVYSTLNDIDGKPDLSITMNYVRDIYALSTKGEKIFFISITIIITLSLILILIILFKFVFKILSQQDSLLNTIPAMVFYKDRNFRYIMTNKAFNKYNTIDGELLIGKTDYEICRDKREAEKIEKSDREIKNTLRPILNIETKQRNKAGELGWYSTSKSPIFDSQGKFNGIVGVTFDITANKEITEKLNFASYYDNVTMLPNRKYLMERLSEAINKSEKINSTFSVFFIDINNFKIVNKIVGYFTDDKLLKVIAEKIAHGVKLEDFISRFGGDEFIVIANEIENDKINSYCNQILKSIKKPWEYRNREYYITASIGIAKYPQDGTNCEELLKNSYISMHLSKTNGKNNFLYYSKELNDKFMERINIEDDLRLALNRKEFVLYYQPQIEVNTKKIIGVEALIRWIHPKKGIVSPGIFIPVAEESGSIVPIGQWVIEESCRQIKLWQYKGMSHIKVSINISAKQFEQENIVDIIKNNIKDHKIHSSSLEVEITESTIMKDKEKVLEKLNRIKEMGVNISLDDFGTGYSSLLYLKSFPIDKVKIDQNFVKDMTNDEDDRAIVKTIVTLSKQLGIKTIAEGVETIEQYNILKELECNEIQGYLFGKPSMSYIIERMCAENILQ